jgi:hypothetical protein
MKSTIFWAVMRLSLLASLPSTLKMEVLLFFDTSAKLCQTMRRHTNPRSEDVIMNGEPNLQKAEKEDIQYKV